MAGSKFEHAVAQDLKIIYTKNRVRSLQKCKTDFLSE
jgi:hypothetical protein